MSLFAVPPSTWSKPFLDSALAFTLDRQPHPRVPSAGQLVMHLTQQVLAVDLQRGTRRRLSWPAKVQHAVGAIVGGLLRAWGRRGDLGPCPVWHSNQADSFTRSVLVDPATNKKLTSAELALEPVVGRNAFRLVTQVLKTAELIAHKGGGRPPPDAAFRMGQKLEGKAARYWPTLALLHLAERFGLTPGNIAAAFQAPKPVRLPELRAPVVLRPFKPDRFEDPWRSWQRAVAWGSSHDAAASELDLEGGVLAEEVVAQNAFAASIPVSFPAEVSCYQPRWYRVFCGDWRLQGRWYATGGGGSPELGQLCGYSSLKPERRALLRIGGAPVVELDVSASHLTLLFGLAGAALPDGSPYEGLGLPRAVVKQWVMELCGKGQPPTRWSKTLAADHPARAYPVKEVGTMVLARYPALRQAAAVVPAELAAQLGQPPVKLVTHYLAAREAAAMTQAMRELRQQGILALPVHDSLIVPVGAEAAARQAIAAGYVEVCGLLPRIERKLFAEEPDEVAGMAMPDGAIEPVPDTASGTNGKALQGSKPAHRQLDRPAVDAVAEEGAFLLV